MCYPSQIKENGMEWYYGEPQATGYFSYGKFFKALQEYAVSYPDDVQITSLNPDGSYVVHFPVNWIRIKPPKIVTDETKTKLASNLLKARQVTEENDSNG